VFRGGGLTVLAPNSLPLPLTRRLTTVLAIVLALALLPAGSAARQGDVGPGLPRGGADPNPTTVGFWAGETVPGTDWHDPATYWNRRSLRLYTPELWDALRRYKVPLYFNLRYKRDFGPVPPGEPLHNDALPVLRTANRLGVPVWGWVLVPYSDGYWAWEGNAAEQFAAVKSLVAWTREKHVKLEGLALDPEPPLNFPFQATAVTMGGGNAGLPSLFQDTIDPAGQCAAWQEYARIPRWGESHGVPISAAPIAATLDDVRDGSLSLQDAGQFVLPDAPWAELFFQAYRSVFNYFSGYDPGPGIVSSYLRSARHRFGETGQISLGSSGRGKYKRLGPLLRDVRVAATLGARDVPIYSLERTLRAYGGPKAILRLVKAARRPFAGPRASKAIEPTAAAASLRAAIRQADATATAADPALTANRGAPQAPNAWPGGCDTNK